MPDPFEFIPGYISPLTDVQHAQIGRIALLWGQVEHFVEQLLFPVTGLSGDELRALGVTDKPIGSKAMFLKAASARVEDEEVKKGIREFCAAIDATKAARNHVFHGVWGWRGDKRSKRIEPAARKSSVPHAPFKATQLDSLEKALCRCSRLGIDLTANLRGQKYRVKYTRFFHHGDNEAEIPKWFQQWSQRNQWSDEDLDQSAKAGQLPRLAAPYPTK